MKTFKAQMEDVKKYLAVLGLNFDQVESLTAEETRIAYHKAAKKTHPDKADHNNCLKKQGA